MHFNKKKGIHERTYKAALVVSEKYHPFSSWRVYLHMKENGENVTLDQVRRALYAIEARKNTDLIKFRPGWYQFNKPYIVNVREEVQ